MLANESSQLEQLYDPLKPFGSDPVFMRSKALYNPRMAGKEGDFYNLTAGSPDVNIQGRPNGFYPRALDGRPGGFPVVVPNTADTYHSARLFGVLQEGAFFDDHTQSLMVELPSYNHKTHLLGYASALFTWTRDGQIMMRAFTPVAIPDFAKGLTVVAIPVLFSVLAVFFVCVSKAPETVTAAVAYVSKLVRPRLPHHAPRRRRTRAEAFHAESLADVALLVLLVGCMATYTLQATLVNGISPKTDYGVYDSPLLAAARFFMPAKVDPPSEEVIIPVPEDETTPRWELEDDETGMEEIGGLLHVLRAASNLGDMNAAMHGVVILLAMLRLIQMWSFKSEVGIFYETLFQSASGVADIMIVTMVILCGFASLGTLALGPHFKQMSTPWGSLGFMMKTFVTGDLDNMHDAVVAKGLDRNPVSAAAAHSLYYAVHVSMGFVMTQFVLAVIVSNFCFVKFDKKKKTADFATVFRLRFEKKGKESQAVIEAISGGNDDDSIDDDDMDRAMEGARSFFQQQTDATAPKKEKLTPLQDVEACLRTAALHLFEMQGAIESLQDMSDSLVDLENALSLGSKEAQPWAHELHLPGQAGLLQSTSMTARNPSQPDGTPAHPTRTRAPKSSPSKPGGSQRGSAYGAEPGGSQRGTSEFAMRRSTGNSSFTPGGSLRGSAHGAEPGRFQRGTSQPLAMRRGTGNSIFSLSRSQRGAAHGAEPGGSLRGTAASGAEPGRSQRGNFNPFAMLGITGSWSYAPGGSLRGSAHGAEPGASPQVNSQPLAMRRGTGNSSFTPGGSQRGAAHGAEPGGSLRGTAASGAEPGRFQRGTSQPLAMQRGTGNSIFSLSRSQRGAAHGAEPGGSLRGTAASGAEPGRSQRGNFNPFAMLGITGSWSYAPGGSLRGSAHGAEPGGSPQVNSQPLAMRRGTGNSSFTPGGSPGGSQRGSAHGAEPGGSQRRTSQPLAMRRGTGYSSFTPGGSLRGSAHGAEPGGSPQVNSQPLAMRRGTGNSSFTPPGGSQRGAAHGAEPGGSLRGTAASGAEPGRFQRGTSQPLAMQRGTGNSIFSLSRSQRGAAHGAEPGGSLRGTAASGAEPGRSQRGNFNPFAMLGITGSWSYAPGGSLRGSAHGAEPGASPQVNSQPLAMRRGTGNSSFTPGGSPGGSQRGSAHGAEPGGSQRRTSQPLAMRRGTGNSSFSPGGSPGGSPRGSAHGAEPGGSQRRTSQPLAMRRGTGNSSFSPGGSPGRSPRGSAHGADPGGSQRGNTQPLGMRRSTGNASLASQRSAGFSRLAQGSNGSRRVTGESMSDGCAQQPPNHVTDSVSSSPRRHIHESMVSSRPSLDAAAEGGPLPNQPETAQVEPEPPMSTPAVHRSSEIGSADNLDTEPPFMDDADAVTSFRQLDDDLPEVNPGSADEAPLKIAVTQSSLGDDYQIYQNQSQAQSRTMRPSHGRSEGRHRRSRGASGSERSSRGSRGSHGLGAEQEQSLRSVLLKGGLEVELPPSLSGQNWRGPGEASTSTDAAQDLQSIPSMMLLPEDSANSYHDARYDKHTAGSKGGLVPEGLPGKLGGPPDAPAAAKAQTPNDGQKRPRGIFGRGLFSREKPSTAPSQKAMGIPHPTKDAIPGQPGAGNADEECAVPAGQLLTDWWSMKEPPSSSAPEEQGDVGHEPSPSSSSAAYDSTPVSRFRLD